MVQLFIDESGVHLTPDHIWTFCCLSGDEKKFSDIHKNLINKLSRQWPTFELNPKLHFVEMLPEQKELVMGELSKLDLEFNIIYCDGGTSASFPGCSQDELKRHMIEQLILHRIKLKDDFDMVFIDKSPLSKKSINLLSKGLKEIGKSVMIYPVPSRRKCALQIADIFTGAARHYLLSGKHKIFFDSKKERILLLQEIYGVTKIEYPLISKTAESILFRF